MSSATTPTTRRGATPHHPRVLEVLRELPVGLLTVQTRSPLVEHDFDVLAELHSRDLDDRRDRRRCRAQGAHADLPSNRAPPLDDATRAGAGIHVQAALSPLMPT